MEFPLDGVRCQLIEFMVADTAYTIVFNELGYSSDVYEVKFDLTANIESDQFLSQPAPRFSYQQLQTLGIRLIDLLQFHYQQTNAQGYCLEADTPKLKRFYDWLFGQFIADTGFKVTANLGQQELHYEIITAKYFQQ